MSDTVSKSRENEDDEKVIPLPPPEKVKEVLVPAYEIHDFDEHPMVIGKFTAVDDGGIIIDDGGRLLMVPNSDDLKKIMGIITAGDELEFIYLGEFSGMKRFNINRYTE